VAHLATNQTGHKFVECSLPSVTLDKAFPSAKCHLPSVLALCKDGSLVVRCIILFRHLTLDNKELY
jgi:hypothetical protein